MSSALNNATFRFNQLNTDGNEYLDKKEVQPDVRMREMGKLLDDGTLPLTHPNATHQPSKTESESQEASKARPTESCWAGHWW